MPPRSYSKSSRATLPGLVGRLSRTSRRSCLSSRPYRDQVVEGVTGARVDVKDVFHTPDELGVRLRRDASLPLEPGLDRALLKTRRTVWCEMLSTTSNSASLLARSRIDHRACSSGGVPHESAISVASAAPSSLHRYSRLGARRLRAALRPSSMNCLRTRETVGWLISTASAISLSDRPGPVGPWSASSKYPGVHQLAGWGTSRRNHPRKTVSLFFSQSHYILSLSHNSDNTRP
jgi:hypothetical protein